MPETRITLIQVVCVLILKVAWLQSSSRVPHNCVGATMFSYSSLFCWYQQTFAQLWESLLWKYKELQPCLQYLIQNIVAFGCTQKRLGDFSISQFPIFKN